jgi:predicted GIY-YIG superfamily endonuclease
LRFELRPGKPEYFPFETQLRTKTGINGLKNFHYVYILVSESDEMHHYTGITENMEARLKAHNNGQDPHTAKYRPWQIETAIAFRSREKAAEFEKYLKSHSGRAFASKHF